MTTAHQPITSCPGCGVTSSENYDGRGSCWPCYVAERPEMARPVRTRHNVPEWVAFRRRILTALGRDGTCEYVLKDRVAGRCPVCTAPLGVRFRGQEATVDLICRDGCEERLVAARLGKAGRR